MFTMWLCELVAFMSFFVPISVAMPRFAACIIGFLTAAGVERSAQAELPASADMCFIAVYLRQQMYILALSCVHTMLMFRLNTQGGPAVVKRRDRAAAMIFLAYWLLSWLISYLAADSTAAAAVTMGILIIFLTHVLLGGLYLKTENPTVQKIISCNYTKANTVAPQQQDTSGGGPSVGVSASFTTEEQGCEGEKKKQLQGTSDSTVVPFSEDTTAPKLPLVAAPS